MRQKTKLALAVTITLILAIVFLTVIVTMIKENGQCVDSPFEYSAKRLSDSGGNYLCSCRSLDPKLLDFTFDEEGIKIIKREQLGQLGNIDFSNIQVKGGVEEWKI